MYYKLKSFELKSDFLSTSDLSASYCKDGTHSGGECAPNGGMIYSNTDY